MSGMLGIVSYGLGTVVGFIVIGVLIFWFIQDITQNKEIDMIAQSCGCRQARELRREHLRIVQNACQSVAMNFLYPYPEPSSKRKAA
jgi:hypothetical protein